MATAAELRWEPIVRRARRSGASIRAYAREHGINENTLAWSEGGARAAADWFSLIASCRMQRVDPWTYLHDVFGRLLDHPSTRVHELTPRNWRLAVESGAIVPRSRVVRP